MPLLDHFRPPLSRTHPWRAFHGAWAAAMARLLNDGVLPPGYYAVPFLDRDGPVEIDVAALQNTDAVAVSDGSLSWKPTAPGLTYAVELPPINDIRVEVMTDDGDPRLAAAIELVSPRNKDRPRSRQAFAAKCAAHLEHGRGVVVVDVVTTRHADLHADLLSALGVEGESEPIAALSAISYRALGRDADGQVQAWPAALAVDAALPTVPLWLAADLAVPLDLEASHTAACVDLRIRRAG
jgi:hypothetical protein